MLAWPKTKRQGKHKAPTPTPCSLPSQSFPQYLKVDRSRHRTAGSRRPLTSWGVEPSGSTNRRGILRPPAPPSSTLHPAAAAAAASTQPQSQASTPTEDVFLPTPRETTTHPVSQQGEPRTRKKMSASSPSRDLAPGTDSARGSGARSRQLS